MRFDPAARSLTIPSCLLAVAAVGYFDCISGIENSMILFYLVPVAVATWFCGRWWGLLIAACSTIALTAADVAAGLSHINIWNVFSGFIAYVLFILLLALLRASLTETHGRVSERTAELQQELTKRKHLEKEIVAVAEQERNRVGRELHDNLSQHLTGTSLFAQGLAAKLTSIDASAAADARKIVELIQQGITLSRDVAHGLFSHELDAEDLASVDSLGSMASQRFGINCFLAEAPKVAMPKSIASHLYWIASEAVANAGKHACAQNIRISLRDLARGLRLEIKDDGRGLRSDQSSLPGIGFRIMRQRAELMGGRLDISVSPAGGTVVTCEVGIA